MPLEIRSSLEIFPVGDERVFVKNGAERLGIIRKDQRLVIWSSMMPGKWTEDRVIVDGNLYYPENLNARPFVAEKTIHIFSPTGRVLIVDMGKTIYVNDRGMIYQRNPWGVLTIAKVEICRID